MRKLETDTIQSHGLIKKAKSWFEFNPPFAATAEDWVKFNARFKNEAPIRYFFNKLNNFIEYRVIGTIKNAKWWIKYRTTQKYHLIDTKLKPGYYDADTLMLYSVFSILTNFIEIECANMYRVFSPWRSRVMDNKRRGIEYLKGMTKANEAEKPEYKRATQALIAAYDYWTDQRLKLMQEMDELLESKKTIDEHSAKKYHEIMTHLDRLDRLHLYKIIKYRQFMWT